MDNKTIIYEIKNIKEDIKFGQFFFFSDYKVINKTKIEITLYKNAFNILIIFLNHLNILLQILIYHHNHIFSLFHFLNHLNILLQILIYHHNHILSLFHFFCHLNILLQILIYHYNHILSLYRFFCHFSITLSF